MERLTSGCRTRHANRNQMRSMGADDQLGRPSTQTLRVAFNRADPGSDGASILRTSTAPGTIAVTVHKSRVTKVQNGIEPMSFSRQVPLDSGLSLSGTDLCPKPHRASGSSAGSVSHRALSFVWHSRGVGTGRGGGDRLATHQNRRQALCTLIALMNGWMTRS
jgi:hypothetical protein